MKYSNIEGKWFNRQVIFLLLPWGSLFRKNKEGEVADQLLRKVLSNKTNLYGDCISNNVKWGYLETRIFIMVRGKLVTTLPPFYLPPSSPSKKGGMKPLRKDSSIWYQISQNKTPWHVTWKFSDTTENLLLGFKLVFGLYIETNFHLLASLLLQFILGLPKFKVASFIL